MPFTNSKANGVKFCFSISPRSFGDFFGCTLHFI